MNTPTDRNIELSKQMVTSFLAKCQGVITIQSDADFTPKGKRSVKIVRHSKSGKKIKPTLAWYVGGKLFRYLDLNEQSIILSSAWKLAA